jgi:hypothetical protein
MVDVVGVTRLNVLAEAMPQTSSAFVVVDYFSIGYVRRSRVYVGEACLRPMVACLCLW